MTDSIPPMEPLAPIIDQLREIAENEIPAPRTCRIQLWDDGTFDAHVYHAIGDDEVQIVRYERTTSEIVWEHRRGARRQETPLTGGEIIIEPAFDDCAVRVIETVEPPYADNR